jgi:putative ABC transport system substrate-binding protein
VSCKKHDYGSRPPGPGGAFSHSNRGCGVALRLHEPLESRRAFVAAICAAILPLPARAQSPPKVVWGYFVNYAGDPRDRIRGHFKSIGLVEGSDVALKLVNIAPHWPAEFPNMVGLIAQERPAVVVLFGFHPYVPELQKRLGDAAIVCYNMALDPVVEGQVQSLRRPGGKLTGTTIDYAGIISKQWDILKEFVPGMKRGGFLVPDFAHDPNALEQKRIFRDAFDAVHKRLGIEVHEVVIRRGASADEVGAAVRKAGAQALVVGTTGLVTPELREFLRKSRIPALGNSHESVRRGLLMGTSNDLIKGEAHAAAIVKLILAGQGPATIPIYRNNAFFLAVNRKTAREAGIEIPASVLLQVETFYDQ